MDSIKPLQMDDRNFSFSIVKTKIHKNIAHVSLGSGKYMSLRSTQCQYIFDAQ